VWLILTDYQNSINNRREH